MYGAPPKPTSGVVPSSATTSATASRIGASASGSIGRSFRTSAARAHRLIEHRAAPWHDPHRNPGEQHRDDDVAEEHRGIHAVPPHRLERDLGREGGVEAGVEHLGAHPARPVLRERPARLPHEPDRQDFGAIAARGADERRRGGAAVDERMGLGQGADGE